jgi:hypothetical protein
MKDLFTAIQILVQDVDCLAPCANGFCYDDDRYGRSVVITTADARYLIAEGYAKLDSEFRLNLEATDKARDCLSEYAEAA